MAETAWWENDKAFSTAPEPECFDVPVELEANPFVPEPLRENTGVTYYTKDELFPGVAPNVIRAITMLDGFHGLYLIDAAVPCSEMQVQELLNLSKVCVVFPGFPVHNAERLLQVFPGCEVYLNAMVAHNLVFPLKSWGSMHSAYDLKVYGFYKLLGYRNSYAGVTHAEVRAASVYNYTGNGSGILYSTTNPLGVFAFGKLIYAHSRTAPIVRRSRWEEISDLVAEAEQDWVAAQEILEGADEN